MSDRTRDARPAFDAEIVRKYRSKLNAAAPAPGEPFRRPAHPVGQQRLPGSGSGSFTSRIDETRPSEASLANASKYGSSAVKPGSFSRLDTVPKSPESSMAETSRAETSQGAEARLASKTNPFVEPREPPLSTWSALEPKTQPLNVQLGSARDKVGSPGGSAVLSSSRQDHKPPAAASESKDRTVPSDMGRARELCAKLGLPVPSRSSQVLRMLLGAVENMEREREELDARLKIAQSNLTLAEQNNEVLEYKLRKGPSSPPAIAIQTQGLETESSKSAGPVTAGIASPWDRLRAAMAGGSLKPEKGDQSLSPGMIPSPSDVSNASSSFDLADTSLEKQLATVQNDLATLRVEHDKVKAAHDKLETENRELSKLRDTLSEELENLSIELFEEANKMVAQERKARAQAEKQVAELQLELMKAQEARDPASQLMGQLKWARSQSSSYVETRTMAAGQSLEATQAAGASSADAQMSSESDSRAPLSPGRSRVTSAKLTEMPGFFKEPSEPRQNTKEELKNQDVSGDAKEVLASDSANVSAMSAYESANASVTDAARRENATSDGAAAQTDAGSSVSRSAGSSVSRSSESSSAAASPQTAHTQPKKWFAFGRSEDSGEREPSHKKSESSDSTGPSFLERMGSFSSALKRTNTSGSSSEPQEVLSGKGDDGTEHRGPHGGEGSSKESPEKRTENAVVADGLHNTKGSSLGPVPPEPGIPSNPNTAQVVPASGSALQDITKGEGTPMQKTLSSTSTTTPLSSTPLSSTPQTPVKGTSLPLSVSPQRLEESFTPRETGGTTRAEARRERDAWLRDAARLKVPPVSRTPSDTQVGTSSQRMMPVLHRKQTVAGGEHLATRNGSSLRLMHRAGSLDESSDSFAGDRSLPVNTSGMSSDGSFQGGPVSRSFTMSTTHSAKRNERLRAAMNVSLNTSRLNSPASPDVLSSRVASPGKAVDDLDDLMKNIASLSEF